MPSARRSARTEAPTKSRGDALPPTPPATDVMEETAPTRSAEYLAATTPREPTGTWPRLKAYFAVALGLLDAMPPIQLPFGLRLAWPYAVPLAMCLLVLMVVLGLPSETATTKPILGTDGAPLGVPEPAGLGFNVFDLVAKLLLILALLYGSLALLKRATGVGGRAGAGALTPTESLRVLSTLQLGPNRTVHVIRAPGGRSFMVGSTPGQVNLIAELDAVPELSLNEPTAPTFLQILNDRLMRSAH